jgi:hypothetical protein
MCGVAALSTLAKSVQRLDYRLADHRIWVQFLTGKEVFPLYTAITGAAHPPTHPPPSSAEVKNW